ncbi:MAG: Hydrogenase formation hypA family protein [Methanomassiliicoccales archaeon PtaB.Bin134]|jgi:hydrogenase expression/formation protein HypD|nr:MAG: Hydrogenase formation hypA family protein [Methanomassiliicoccales archaeon PtaB.Bin134]
MMDLRYRDEATAQKIMSKLRAMDLELRFMHVCGTHQDTLVKFGLERMLSEVGITIGQGPGCPVCVTTTKEVVEAITLARSGVTVTVFGDMMAVPTPIGSLADIKAEGADVRVVYSVEDALRMSREVEQMVFMAIGFETTSPSTAYALLHDPPENFSVLSCHRLLPPALIALFAMGEVRIDGLIQPGHVATITGLDVFKPFAGPRGVPQVITGFEPLDLLMGVYMLAKQVKEGRSEVENEYPRVVRPEGNPKAREMLARAFRADDRAWRGFPVLPQSSLEVADDLGEHNARLVHEKVLSQAPKVKEDMGGCRCGEVLRGIIRSEECPAFGKGCSPKRPMGPCMVSREGSCNISYRYRE